MKVQAIREELAALAADAAIIFFYEDGELFNEQKKMLTAAFPAADGLFLTEDFSGKKKSKSSIYTGSKSLPRIILAGLGKKSGETLGTIRSATAAASAAAKQSNPETLAIFLPSPDGISTADTAQAALEGALLSGYKYDKYITEKKDAKKKPLKKIFLVCEDKSDVKSAQKAADYAKNLCDGVILARDLANAPNNEIYPESLAERAAEAGKEAGFDVKILDKKKIQSLKMGGLLAVNAGSKRPPVFIIMEYKGGKSDEKPVVLVGKGVTFDTGGISIKPGAGMSAMKFDMHGSATVIGTMYSVAKNKLPINVVGLVPATDNMPDGSAYVPGDIVTFMNGKTAEIDNTDAEGRLILADALSYADRYKPQAVVDAATLTGACVVALGSITTGLMGNDDSLKSRLKKSAENTGEYVCELPLYEEYEDQIKSDYADVKNSGGRAAGTITAALFLRKFIGDYPWAHLDIAGTGMLDAPTELNPKGGSGVGVRLLSDMLKNW
ncbi:leucyl aminopeptidase [Ignavibacteria bacterium]|nr:leucyl aminopeptidase [Bacteroidota bacterium]MCZ2133305.1 leucyl aminopeptidase [Bacteroidota bacterium]